MVEHNMLLCTFGGCGISTSSKLHYNGVYNLTNELHLLDPVKSISIVALQNSISKLICFGQRGCICYVQMPINLTQNIISRETIFGLSLGLHQLCSNFPPKCFWNSKILERLNGIFFQLLYFKSFFPVIAVYAYNYIAIIQQHHDIVQLTVLYRGHTCIRL